MRVGRPRRGTLIENAQEIIAKCLPSYKRLYKNNSLRGGVDKFWLLSLQMRTLLLILVLEKIVEEGVTLNTLLRLTSWSYMPTLKKNLDNTMVPNFDLEETLRLADYAGISFFELKKTALAHLMQSNGEQNEKIYGFINKLYSQN